MEEARRLFERMNSYAIYRIVETIRIMAKAAMRDAQGRIHTRYCNLGTGQLVVGESSPVVWHFVL